MDTTIPSVKRSQHSEHQLFFSWATSLSVSSSLNFLSAELTTSSSLVSSAASVEPFFLLRLSSSSAV